MWNGINYPEVLGWHGENPRIRMSKLITAANARIKLILY